MCVCLCVCEYWHKCALNQQQGEVMPRRWGWTTMALMFTKVAIVTTAQSVHSTFSCDNNTTDWRVFVFPFSKLLRLTLTALVLVDCVSFHSCEVIIWKIILYNLKTTFVCYFQVWLWNSQTFCFCWFCWPFFKFNVLPSLFTCMALCNQAVLKHK